jgi:hypothetical protein
MTQSNQPVTRRDRARTPVNPASPPTPAGTPHPRPTPSPAAVDWPRNCGLSPRKVRDLVCVGQRWSDSHGRACRVAAVYRADRLVALQSPVWPATRRVSFAELGWRYRLEVS